MNTYSNYLGAKRCCDLRGLGAKGLMGPTGAQGPIGPYGYTGPEGIASNTGSTGPTGPSQWNISSFTGPTGPGYTGIGYTGDVMVYGALYVQGGIDPTYLALTPQTSGPAGFPNPLWIDSINGNALRSQNIYMDNPSGTGNTGAYISLIPDSTNQIILNDGAAVNANSNTINYSSMTISDTLDTLTIDKNNITHTSATTGLTIGSTGVNKDINIDTAGLVNIGDIASAGNSTYISVDDVNQVITLSDVIGNTYFVMNFASSSIGINGWNGVDIESGSGSGVGNINLTAKDPTTGKINVNATNGVVINQQGIVLPDTTITTLNGNTIEIFEDKNTSSGFINQVQIDTSNLFIDNSNFTFQTQSYSRVSPNELEIYDHTSSGTNASITKISSTSFDYNPSGTKPLFYQFTYEVSNIFRYDLNGIRMGATGTGVAINNQHIKYPATYNTASATLGTTSNAVQTFNISVAPFTAFLPNASSGNVGTQYIITNTNANALSVSTTGGTQLIYSSTAPASATSRSLAQGNSRIFTAILTTGASTFGWSMV